LYIWDVIKTLYTMKKSNKFRFSSLFPKSSFLIGAGSVFSVAGNYYSSRFRSSLGDPDADAKALASDWEAIGNDFRKVMSGLDKTPKRG